MPLTADAITTLAAGFDGSVRRVQTAYDALGNGYLVTSYNAGSGGSIVNQVEDIYNGLDQLVQEYQAHSGAVVVGTTPSVQYAYTEMSGGQNNSRLVSMTYPNGRVLDYNYNTGPDSNISRLSSISDGSATLESYLYLGLDTVVERDHPQDGVNMTYISQTGSTGDAGDQYTGLDRFGRVAEVNWYKPSTSTSVDDFQYGYDPNGNVMYMTNAVHPAFSELYHANGASNGYDGLNQLSAFARGTLSDTNSDGIPDTVASPSTSESWSLDALGNFSSVTLNGTPTSRTTNQQNEVTAVGSSSLAFDANGNTTTDDQGHTLIYDAWNRLIQVKSGGTVLATYSYDGLGRRVTENTGTLRDMYFSSAWQVVEEDAAGVMKDQYVWSPVYVNALIERDTPTQRLYVQQDADWNVTSLVSSAGSPVERYLYDPYGGVTYLTGSWGSRASSSYSWLYFFQGGRFATATGLYNFQHRDYSPSLGRWLEDDPSGFGGGDNNLYRAEGDGPVDSTDPTGLKGVILSGKNQPPPPPPGSRLVGPLLGPTDDDGFWSSLGHSVKSIYLGGKGTIQVTLGALPDWVPGHDWGAANAADTLNEAYDLGPLGQTQNSPGFYRYGTRAALGVATVATVSAVAVGTLEYFFLGNQSIQVEGLLAGGRMGKGGIFQIRPTGRAPWIRFDYHALRQGMMRLPHIDFNGLGIKHFPWNWFGF
ncbi:MAG TPA: RHS repeat-associated core domain-containing protein [Gemmataceae bacterium]|nr:RHS repeat-associated core domain-containing protein [Gemmataceae bacterium]